MIYCSSSPCIVGEESHTFEENGFILCESKSAKRYKSPLFLTEKGKEAGKKIYDAVDRVLEEVGVGLTDEQRKTFYTYLTIISDNLEKITDKMV